MAFGVSLRQFTDELQEDWRDDALCREVDPEMFFPAKGESSGPAVQVCRLCSVAVDCLDYALRTEQNVGVWGGIRMNNGVLSRASGANFRR